MIVREIDEVRFFECGGEFEETDFVNLPNYNIYLKLMIDGVTSQPFSAVTLPLPEHGISKSDVIIDESRLRYARLRKEVEQDILVRCKIETRSRPAQKGLF